MALLAMKSFRAARPPECQIVWPNLRAMHMSLLSTIVLHRVCPRAPLTPQTHAQLAMPLRLSVPPTLPG